MLAAGAKLSREALNTYEGPGSRTAKDGPDATLTANQHQGLEDHASFGDQILKCLLAAWPIKRYTTGVHPATVGGSCGKEACRDAGGNKSKLLLTRSPHASVVGRRVWRR